MKMAKVTYISYVCFQSKLNGFRKPLKGYLSFGSEHLET